MRLLLLLIPSLALAVSITDTLYLPDGSLAQGGLAISLVSGTASDSRTYAGYRKEVRVANGAVSVDLAPNSTLTPAGTLYKVEYKISNAPSPMQTEYWSVPTGGPYAIREVRWQLTAADYSVNQSGLTWTVSAGAHGIRHRNLLVACYDSSGNEVECAKNVNPSTYTVTARFSASQTGRVFINGSSLGGYTPNPAKAFTSATSVTFANSEHNLNTARLVGACYDSSGDEFACQITVNPTTFAVTATFASAATGILVIGGK